MITDILCHNKCDILGRIKVPVTIKRPDTTLKVSVILEAVA